MKEKTMKDAVAILCAGGPAPGINTVISAVTKIFLQNGYTVLGLNGGYKSLFSVRGGISNIQKFNNIDESSYWGFQPNLGLGIGIKGFNLDYAFTRMGAADAGYYTHVFSINMKLSKPVK